MNNKNLAILATGDELVQGQVQDSNIYRFSQLAFDAGIAVHQHAMVNDDEDLIAEQLRFLLEHNAAVVLTGGLGPTSDDRTRYALAKVVEQSLECSEEAWQHVIGRLRQFNLEISENNRQQTLFPRDAALIINTRGSACGCQLTWRDKLIFMLPGPPHESMPMFQEVVMPSLIHHGFAQDMVRVSWLLLGVIESEVSLAIDSITQESTLNIGYCWNYPYVEVKAYYPRSQAHAYDDLIRQIEQYVTPYLVSKDKRLASQLLLDHLKTWHMPITIHDQLTRGVMQQAFKDFDQLIFTDQPVADSLHLYAHGLERFHTGEPANGVEHFHCELSEGQQPPRRYSVNVVFRGHDVLDYAKEYICWILAQVLADKSE